MEQQLKAVIVDDEEAYREAICDVLEVAGVKMYVATDASDAEVLFGLFVPDLVILDVMMPGMSGLDLIKRLRASVGWERVPIVVASALGLKADRERALAAGADAFLSKPFNSKELRAAVREFLPLAQTAPLLPAA